MGKILVGCSWGLLLLGAGIVLLPLLVVLVTSFSTLTASPELSLPWLNLLPITHHYPLPISLPIVLTNHHHIRHPIIDKNHINNSIGVITTPALNDTAISMFHRLIKDEIVSCQPTSGLIFIRTN